MSFQRLTPKEFLQAEVVCKNDKAMEKATWSERIQKFKTLDFNDPKTFSEASNPIGLRAAYLGYKQAEAGLPTGYMISLDASSSGLQLLSLLISCIDSWMLCGGDLDRCVDAYIEIYNAMGLTKLSRKQVKQAIMTAFYGSTRTPENTFGDKVDLFYDTVSNMAPGAWQLNLDLQEVWHRLRGSVYSWTMPDNFHACIETKKPEYQDFTLLGKNLVITKYVDGRPDFHKGLGPNVIHSVDGFIVREMIRRCSYRPEKILEILELIKAGDTHGTTGASAPMVQTLWDQFKRTGFLSTRIFDYLYKDTLGLVDAGHILDLISSLPMQPFQLVTNHDCFRCHPNYGNDLRRQYNTILADINDSKMLQAIVSEILGRPIKIRKFGTIDRNLILNSNYALS